MLVGAMSQEQKEKRVGLKFQTTPGHIYTRKRRLFCLVLWVQPLDIDDLMYHGISQDILDFVGGLTVQTFRDFPVAGGE